MFNVTAEMLRKIAGAPTNKGVVDGVVKYLPEVIQKYEINTPLRLAHFLSQIAWESDHFRTLQEYASGQAYEGRRDLGNVNRGDGVRYKGRGVIQCTGKANYDKYGKLLNLDLVDHPEWVATPHVSMLIAGEYWKRTNLNHWADEDDVRQVTHIINGGFNGLDGRKAMLVRAKQVLRGATEVAMLDDHDYRQFDTAIVNDHDPIEPDVAPEAVANVETTSVIV